MQTTSAAAPIRFERRGKGEEGWLLVRERKGVEQVAELSSNFPLLNRAARALKWSSNLNVAAPAAESYFLSAPSSTTVKIDDEKQRIRSVPLGNGREEGRKEGRSLLNGRVMPAANHVHVDPPRARWSRNKTGKEESVMPYLHAQCAIAEVV